MPSININDLNNAKADVDHIAAIATSPAEAATDRLGRIKLTLQGVMASIGRAADAVMAGIGYSPPVTYASGLSMTLRTQTVDYAGNTYAPKSADLPFVTTGTFEVAKFRLIQGIVFSDLAAAAASSLMGFIQAGTGAVPRTVQDKLRERISVMDFGAKGDGVTDDTLAFTRAGVRATELGVDLYAPAPAVSYLLNSSPTFAKNLGIKTSLSWYTGVGLLPAHRFIAKSEGVNPRVFDVRNLNYSETKPNRTTRMWGGVAGWIDITDEPAAGYEGTWTDAVAIDGRARVSVRNGRGWAGVFLVNLEPGSSDKAQVYGVEIDVNDNLAHSTGDSTPLALGLAVVSGGAFRPRVGVFVNATQTPNNGGGDNRWNFGLSFYDDSCYEANIYIYDGNKCDAMRIPSTSRGLHWTGNGNLDNFYCRINSFTFRLEFTISANRSIDFLNNVGQKVVSISENSIDYSKPIVFSGVTYNAIPASIDIDRADMHEFAVSGTVTGGLTGAINGRRIITITNVSGAAVTISKNSRMATAGGSAVVLARFGVVQFTCSAGTYLQVAPPSVNSA